MPPKKQTAKANQISPKQHNTRSKKKADDEDYVQAPVKPNKRNAKLQSK